MVVGHDEENVGTSVSAHINNLIGLKRFPRDIAVDVSPVITATQA